MSKSQRPFRRTFFTFALVSIIGVSFLSIAVAGTSAAGVSIVDSVSAFFGLQSESSETADADRGARAQRIPLDSPLNVYGTGWLRLDASTEESVEANEVNGPVFGEGSSKGEVDNPLVPKDFDCTTIPSKGIDKMENFRAGAIMIHCGLAEGGSPTEEELEGGGEPPLAFGATDVNLVTGADTSPHVIQSETFTTVNPDNPNQVLIGYNDSRGAAGNNYSGASYSTDGGTTFTRLTVAATGQSPFTNTFGDPVVLYNKPTSTWFTVWLDAGCGGQGLGGYKSTDPSNPAGWTHFCVHNGGSDDRESGWADNNPSSPFYGRMYISYNDFAVGGGALRVHYTTNNGTTWSAPVSITGSFLRNVQITGDAATGTVYIAGMNENGGGFPHNDNNLIYRSTDGGATWTNTYTGPAFPGPGVTAVGYFACMFPDGGGFWRHEGWGQPAVHNGVVSLVYAQHGTGADAGDVYYIRSTDMGATFGPPFKLNSDSTTRPQWQPNLSASPTGTLLATWYDARDSATCTKGNPAVPCYRMYSRKSNDNGATWQPDDTLSDVMSPLPGQSDPNIQATYAGDYDYGSAILTKHSTSWVDGRNPISGASQQDAYTDKELVGFAVTTTVPACNSVISTQPVDFVINLSDAVNPATVQASDFTVNGIPANSFVLSGGNTTITFHFNTSPVTVQGPQAMHISAGAFNRTSDNMPVFEFGCSFCYAITPLQVISTVPAVGGTFTPPAPGNYNYDINFNQPVDPASVQDSDLMVSGNSGPSVTGHSLLNGNMTVRFTLHMNFGGTLTASLAVGAITANGCNGNAVFTGNYTVEGCPPQNHYNIAQIGGPIVPGTVDIGNHVDDGVTNVVLPFSYSLYGVSYSSVNLSSNGNAQFVTSDSAFSNTCLPWTTHDGTIFPYWDDLLTNASGSGIFTSISGSAPNRIFNIEWRATYFSGGGTANFELRLYEGQSRFDVIYGTVTQTNASSTAGVQRNNTDFDQYFCNGSGGAATGGQSYTLQSCGTPTPTSTGTPPATPTNTATSTATATPTGSPSCTPSWASGASLPGVTVRAVGNYFPTNGLFYAMGGRSADTAGSDYTHPFEYNPGSNSWTTKSATYPDTQVNNMACGVLTSSGTPLIYCVGGSAAGATTATARVFAYNPVTDAITTLGAGDNWPGNAAGTILPGGFAVVNNKLYILGGFNINVGSTNQIWEFDPAQAAGSRWLQRVNTPANIMYASTAAIGGIIYVGGASDFVGALVTDTTTSFSFNPATNTIGTIATVPRANGETRAVVLNNKMYVLGGGRVAPNPSNEVDIYDPSTNTWSIGLPFVTARRNFPADSDGSHIFLAGGYAPTAPDATMEIFTSGVCGSPSATPTFTPTATTTASASATPSPSCTPSTWQLGPPQDPARYAFQSALGSDNKLYVAGGGSADNMTFYDQVSRYDSTTNTWSNVAPLPVGLNQGTMGAWNGKIYVAGGFLGGTAVTNALRIYDIATNTWTSGPDLPTPGVEAAAGAVVNGKFYVMGGDDFNNLLNTTYIYDTATNTWSTGATLPDSRTNSYATAAGGLIYVYGGLTSLSPLTATDTLLRYDPVANSWSNLGSAGTGGLGNYGGISPFGTGQLLITDGANASYAPSATTHVFTISGGTFSAGPAMLGAHAGHAQGTLADGRVLVADGLVTSGTGTNTVELLGGPCGTPSATPTNTPTSTATATSTGTPSATPTCIPGGTPGPWTTSAPYPITDVRYGFVQTATHAYVFGGVSDGSRVNNVNRMDFATGAWEPRAAMPFASEAPTCALMASTGIVYCTEGDTGSGFASYNIATDSWTPLAAIPGGDHYGSASGAFNGKVFVAGGSTSFSNAVQVYDVATNTWSAGTAAPNDFLLAGYQQVGQYLYVVGGFEVAGPSRAIAAMTSVLSGGQSEAPDANNATTLRLDMTSAPGAWTTGPAFTPARADFGLAFDAGSGKLYAIGGDTTGGGFFDSTNLVDELSVASWPAGSWAASPPNLLPPNRQANQAGFYGAGQIWSVGGLNGATFQFLSEVQRRTNGGAVCGTPTATSTGTPATPTATATATCTPGYSSTTSTGNTVVAGTDFVAGSNCDDCSNAVALPFPFTFYGTTFNSVNAVSNGNLQFSSAATTFSNTCLPAAGFNNLIAPHWDDLLLTGATDGIYTSTSGSAPNRIFNIEWRGGFFSGGGMVDLEARLYETSGQIDFIYGTVDNNGTSATVGLQQGTGASFTQFECNTGGLSPGFGISYVPTTCVTPSATPTNTPTATATASATPTNTPTATPTSTPTATPTSTPATSIQFSSTTYMEDESQVASITITRTGNTAGTDTVTFSTSDGTAMGGAACTTDVDYISVNQSVTFNPGETSKVVTVSICADTLTENDQTVNLALNGANVGNPSTAVLTINDTASRFRNATGIVINQNAAADPYPATITVSGGPSIIGSVRVTLYDVALNMPDNMDVMLVSPGGRAFVLMANAGGTSPNSPATLNFIDLAGQVIPDNGPLVTADYEPTSYGAVAAFPPPAPTSFNLPGSTVGGTGTQTLFGNFGGTNSNGVWSLYIRDDTLTEGGVVGNIAGGWGIEFLGTTAANASIAGRVTTADGRPIRNVNVVITGNALEHPITATTGSLGWFTFDGLATGETYVVTVNSRRFTFSTPSRVITLVDNVADADFVADPQ